MRSRLPVENDNTDQHDGFQNYTNDSVFIEWDFNFMIRPLGSLVIRRLLHKMAVPKDARKVSFRCATFNILAPCYNKLK
jgi:hypothetical protein